MQRSLETAREWQDRWRLIEIGSDSLRLAVTTANYQRHAVTV